MRVIGEAQGRRRFKSSLCAHRLNEWKTYADRVFVSPRRVGRWRGLARGDSIAIAMIPPDDRAGP